MTPLSVATNRYLHGVLSIATDGYLCAATVQPEIPTDLVHPTGMGKARRKQIMEEDETIMAVIIAFLETKR